MFFLFKLILSFFLFLFILGFLSLIVLRYKVKRFLKKNSAGYTENDTKRKPGEVWVDDKRDSSQSGSNKLKNVGDYVDYEEVKE